MLHVERAGHGRDLVLLHGWGLHGRIWQPLLPLLEARFRLHVVDLPGHGQSRSLPFGTVDCVADLVAPSVPPGATLCGWSLGGLVALRLATRHRDRVHALALLATTPCFVEREDWPHAMKAETLDDFARGLRDEPEETLRAFVTLNVLGGPGGRTRVRELTTLLGAVPAPMPETLEAGLALLRGTDLRPEAGRIAQPAAVIHGERDVLVPVGAGRWLAATLPNARLHEIGGAAHLPFVSHARAVADAIESLHG